MEWNVKVICTTDDPIHSLEHHVALQKNNFGCKVLPTWRPDKAMAIEDTTTYNSYLDQLSEVTEISIDSFQNLMEALQKRHDFFASLGCKLSDHGIERFCAAKYTDAEITNIFAKSKGR